MTVVDSLNFVSIENVIDINVSYDIERGKVDCCRLSHLHFYRKRNRMKRSRYDI